MSELVDHLAHLTGFRDRDVLDVTLVSAFKDMLRPESVAIYRCVADPQGARWLTRARLGRDDVAATADPAWIELEHLPRLEDHPHRLACLRTHEVQQVVVEGRHLSLFPLDTDREVVGVLELESEQPLSPSEQRTVGSILRIYRNFEGLLDYSERDTLTGLLNRKTFDETFLKTAVPMAGSAAADGRRVIGGESSHWLGVIDIDHFKAVNDTYGHLIGDEVLLLMSRLMRSSFRFHDRLYRFGGEEFVVLMRCGSEADAAHAFERFRYNTEQYVFPQVGHKTVSIGFSQIKPTDSPSSAFERADKAVYYAKQHGRNQVCGHAELVARGELEDGSAISGDVELF
jgi:diguanylate cyclase (GGDEF)-like protein